MKIFSDIDKEIIKEICEKTTGTFLRNYLFNKYQGYNFPYDKEKDSFGISINQMPDKPINDHFIYFEERELEIYNLARLLKYLEDNDYIIVYQDVDDILIKGNTETTNQTNPVNYELKETKYKKLLLHYLGKVIKPNLDLIDLKNHKFKTVEDRKHSDQLEVQWAGIIIAIILALVGIFLNLSK